MIATKFVLVISALLVIPIILIPSFSQPAPSCEELSCDPSIRITTLLLDSGQYSGGDDILLTVTVINEAVDPIDVSLAVQASWLVGVPNSESVTIPSNTSKRISISFSSSLRVTDRQILQVSAHGTDPDDSSVFVEATSLMQIPFKPAPTPIYPIAIFVIIVLGVLAFVLLSTREKNFDI
tara:strand:- start:37 stop:576 length:540 start_codon:yes stop_codon:yes gene_type:complete